MCTAERDADADLRCRRAMALAHGLISASVYRVCASITSFHSPLPSVFIATYTADAARRDPGSVRMLSSGRELSTMKEARSWNCLSALAALKSAT